MRKFLHFQDDTKPHEAVNGNEINPIESEAKREVVLEDETMENSGPPQQLEESQKEEVKEDPASVKRLSEASISEEFEEYCLPKTSDVQHVMIVHNEIHSSSCVLYYLECSRRRNRPSEASKLEFFYHLVQVGHFKSLGCSSFLVGEFLTRWRHFLFRFR